MGFAIAVMRWDTKVSPVVHDTYARSRFAPWSTSKVLCSTSDHPEHVFTKSAWKFDPLSYVSLPVGNPAPSAMSATLRLDTTYLTATEISQLYQHFVNNRQLKLTVRFSDGSLEYPLPVNLCL